MEQSKQRIEKILDAFFDNLAPFSGVVSLIIFIVPPWTRETIDTIKSKLDRSVCGSEH